MVAWDRLTTDCVVRGSSASGAMRLRASTRAFPAVLFSLHAMRITRTQRSVNAVAASAVYDVMLMRGTCCDVDGQVAPRLPS